MADETTGQPDKAPETTDTQVVANNATTEKTTNVVAAETTKTEKVKTAIQDPGEAPGPGPAKFPDNWREEFASFATGKTEGEEFDKELKRLQRIKNPADSWKSYRSLEAKFKKGEDPEPFPAEGTDEEKSAWRKAHGLPESAKEYLKDFSLDDGLVIGDNDKPIVEQYLAAAHEGNVPPEAVKQSLNWYFAMREGETQKRMEKDESDKMTARDTLRDELGSDFNKHLGAGYDYLTTVFGDDADSIMAARLPDGTMLGNNSRFIMGLSQTALELNPAHTITPSGGDSAKSLKTRMTEIESIMSSDRNKYYRDGLDVEYRKLVEVEEKMNKRGIA